MDQYNGKYCISNSVVYWGQELEEANKKEEDREVQEDRNSIDESCHIEPPHSIMVIRTNSGTVVRGCMALDSL